MKGKGVFRGMMAAIAGLIATGPKLRAKHYPDPIMQDPYIRDGSGRRKFERERGRRMKRPPCEPGTITFHDKCVRYYGRKKADQIHSDWQHKDRLGNRDRLDRIPSLANFAAMRPWAWLNG